MFCNGLLESGYGRFGGHGGGGMFIMMGFGFLVFSALIYLAYKLMKRHHSHLYQPNNLENNAAIIILNQRFANGEIDEEEYTKRKTILSHKN
jgi:putative membrane protein